MVHENSKMLMDAILDNPEAPQMIADLQHRLQEERSRREQFYADIDDDMKAEFIKGEIVIQSPAKKEHTDAVGALLLLLSPFVQISQLGYVGFEKVMSAFSRNDYEPDVVFFGVEKSAVFKKGQWKYPPPDFVVEVLSDGTKQRDRGVKFMDYEAHGVQEYWIIDPEEESVEQYLLHDGKYKLHFKASQGIITSKVISGFAIDIRAIFDEQANLEALRKLI
jgi:Uma2 family endonuclease